MLVLASVVDPDIFLHFEITPHGTVLFYITVFGSVLAAARIRLTAMPIPGQARVEDAAALLAKLSHAETLAPFLTLAAYPQLG